jgi:hypothetical protein
MWEGARVSLLRTIAIGCLAVALVAAASHAHPAHAAPPPSLGCGAYAEGAEFDGSEDHRVVISPQGVPCSRGIAVVRSFRSLLPKRHHGGSPGWWTLSSPSGWRCQNSSTGGLCQDGKASLEFTVESTFPAQRCRNGITIGHGAAGVIILSWRNVGCAERHSLAHGAARTAGRSVGGFTCHRLNLRAGGGGTLCRRGSRFIELGFE